MKWQQTLYSGLEDTLAWLAVVPSMLAPGTLWVPSIPCRLTDDKFERHCSARQAEHNDQDLQEVSNSKVHA